MTGCDARSGTTEAVPARGARWRPWARTFLRPEWQERAVLVAACTILLGCLACAGGEPAEPGESFDVRDLPRLELEEELRIGSVEDPDRGFSRIGRVVVDGDEVFVFESLQREIRVYSAEDGRFLRAMGGEGEGPGEFRGSSIRFGVVRDTVWVMDWTLGANWMLTRFERDGTLISAESIDGVRLDFEWTGFPVVVAPVMADEAGGLLGDINPERGTSGLDADTIRVPRVRFTLAGEVVDTAAWYTLPLTYPEGQLVEVGESRYSLPRAGLDDPLVLFLSEGRIRIDRRVPEASGDTVFRVTRTGPSGDTLYSHRYRYTPVPYPEEVKERAAARSTRSGRVLFLVDGRAEMVTRRPQDSARAHAEILERLPWPRFQRPVGGERRVVPHEVGPDGSLWLQREETGGETRRWTVLGPDGVPVGEAHLPEDRFGISWVDGDHLWATERDELGIPWLVRYGIHLPEEGGGG